MTDYYALLIKAVSIAGYDPSDVSGEEEEVELVDRIAFDEDSATQVEGRIDEMLSQVVAQASEATTYNFAAQEIEKESVFAKMRAMFRAAGDIDIDGIQGLFDDEYV